VSQQEQIASVPVRPDGTASVSAPAVAKPSRPSSAFWGRFAIPLFAVLAALAFVALATVRWNEWTGDAVVQTTDDAYVQADLTRLSSRVAGEVLNVAFQDFQRVKTGDLLVQIDPADYQAEVDRAAAGVAAAQAALDTLAGQIELQYATIAQGEAARVSAEAHAVETGQERVRQETLSTTVAGTLQRLQQAVADDDRARADVHASRAVIAAQRHELEVLNGTKKQRAADLDAAKAELATAKLKLGYTRVVAPFDGVTSERQVQPRDYVNIGTNLINVVPLPNVYVIANYKETQLTHVEPGQPVEVTVDSFPNQTLHGRVERISPASGSQFALLPPDNATGNFTKVVQRIPIRIMFDKNQPLLDRLLPGMSVITSINTRDARANGGK
jgi:membrane fusion protein (multidrug efflux system)